MFILTINHWIQWAAGSWEKSQKVWPWGGGTDKDLRKIHIVKKTHAYKQSPGPTGTNQCKVYTWIRCTVSCISTREWFIHFPFVAAIWLCNNLTQLDSLSAFLAYPFSTHCFICHVGIINTCNTPHVSFWQKVKWFVAVKDEKIIIWNAFEKALAHEYKIFLCRG